MAVSSVNIYCFLVPLWGGRTTMPIRQLADSHGHFIFYTFMQQAATKIIKFKW